MALYTIESPVWRATSASPLSWSRLLEISVKKKILNLKSSQLLKNQEIFAKKKHKLLVII